MPPMPSMKLMYLPKKPQRYPASCTQFPRQLSESVSVVPVKPTPSSLLYFDICPVIRPTRAGWQSGTLHRTCVNLRPWSAMSRRTFGMNGSWSQRMSSAMISKTFGRCDRRLPAAPEAKPVSHADEERAGTGDREPGGSDPGEGLAAGQQSRRWGRFG